jgi:cobalamin-dependent methionine synthase I
MLQDLAPGAKSAVGLSNVSNGAPNNLRPYLNRTYLMMLMKYGIHSAIVDAFDQDLIDIARGKKPELVKVVHTIMDGGQVDVSKLTPEDAKYAKTVKVLLGIILYSHSWLDT